MGVALMMEAVRSSETLAQSQDTTLWNNPENNRFAHGRESLKSYTTVYLLVCQRQATTYYEEAYVSSLL
jgi:hypothetical protein